ncbi:MerR family transcriptional regulator [Microbispora hainanensis]|uniref:MerR family transcriptional regulator n=1 Tax=Microbispora hainanensis TaxID=568844 RepID=A0ABZ1SS93_9ACTN|nr:MerR family transcriptional regulator [Microbispora hainanensis]
MIGTDDAGRRWSIGELARATGMTVRALYHYDEIGLLRASERTPAGHRRYTERDLRRLYRVRTLRTLGLSLEEIAGVLDGAADDPESMRHLLTAQLRRLDEHAELIGMLRRRVRGLLRQAGDSSGPDPDRLMTALELMSVFETYLTEEQRERLAERRAALGGEGVEAAKHEWKGLVEEGLRLVETGVPAEDERARDLVRRWDALAGRFHPAGPEGERTRAAAQRMWQDNSAEIGRSLPWPAERIVGLVAYLAQARHTG